MELRLEIVSFQKTLMGDGRIRVFDETGGSIGRGRDNGWVLPDPNRYVSSRHAEIDFVDGRFRITDTSTNGVFLNGSATALGRDGRALLSDGDRLVLGDYEIEVRVPDMAAASPGASPPEPLRARPLPGRPVSARQASAPPLSAAPPGLTPNSGRDAPDILDVVSRRRSEPRLGNLPLPEDPAESVPRPAPRPPAVASPPLPPAAAPAPRIPVPRVAAHVRPSPPRPAAGQPAQPPGIPDDVDLLAPAGGPARPPAPPRAAVPPAAPPRAVLPDDLDDLLPGGPGEPAPPPPAAGRPQLPDDLDDLLPPPAARPADLPPAGQPPADVLPEGVPLLRPVPGTGNRQEPLSAPPPAPRPAPRPAAVPARPAPVAADAPADGELAAALIEGLGLDGDALAGVARPEMAATVARAARAAAVGIAGAIDARNAVARTAGIDPAALGEDGENPFMTYRSGEAALRHCLTGAAPGRTLDAASRDAVAMLTATTGATAAALQAVLDRLAADGPPGTADRVREIFGTAFLTAYHRETSRSN